jgi:hypothetical protein
MRGAGMHAARASAFFSSGAPAAAAAADGSALAELHNVLHGLWWQVHACAPCSGASLDPHRAGALGPCALTDNAV